MDEWEDLGPDLQDLTMDSQETGTRALSMSEGENLVS